MISQLTQTQIDQFPGYVDKWLKIGLSTDRINRSSAAAYAARLMKVLKREYVATVVLAGPLEAWCGVCMLSQVGSQVWSQVGWQVRSQVESQVWSQVESQVGWQVRSQVESQVESFTWPYLDGSFMSSYCAFYDYFSELVELADWSLIYDATGLGLIYPLRNVVVICEKPIAIKMQDGVLHCETGPAWEYADNTRGWSINGVAVAEKVVLRPDEQTLTEIRGEKNEEVKRIRIERFGWERFLKDVGANPVHSRRNDVDGTRESLMRTEDGLACLVCACPSTGKVFALEVDPSLETCEQAQDYLHPTKSGICLGAT